MLYFKKGFYLAILLLFSEFLFANEPNMIISESFSGVKTIYMDLSFENIFIENIYGNEILVELYSNNKNKLPAVSAQDNSLILKSVNKKLYPSDYCTVKIYIPTEAFFDEVNIKSGNGSITFESINADEIILNSVNGKICGKELTGISNIQISSIAGEIDINSAETETISVETVSGSIYLASLKTDYFDSKSESGSIEIILKNPPKASSFIKNISGNIELAIQKKSGFDFIASSTSGTLHDEINNLRLSPRNEYRNSFFDGGAEIQVRTTSGNIILK